jgi:hypothetical protein
VLMIFFSTVTFSAVMLAAAAVRWLISESSL